LKDLVRSSDKVAIVIPDITRPLPSERLLPWIFEELHHVPKDQFVIVNGTGSHRPTPEMELAAMVRGGCRGLVPDRQSQRSRKAALARPARPKTDAWFS